MSALGPQTIPALNAQSPKLIRGELPDNPPVTPPALRQDAPPSLLLAVAAQESGLECVWGKWCVCVCVYMWCVCLCVGRCICLCVVWCVCICLYGMCMCVYVWCVCGMVCVFLCVSMCGVGVIWCVCGCVYVCYMFCVYVCGVVCVSMACVFTYFRVL